MGANTCKLCLGRDDDVIVIAEISLGFEGTRDNTFSCREARMYLYLMPFIQTFLV